MILKRIISLFSATVVAASLVLTPTMRSSATWKDTGKKFTITEGGIFNRKTYTFKIFRDDYARGGAISYVVEMLPLSSPAYHVQGKDDVTLSIGFSETYSSQTSTSFSQSLGFSVGYEIVSATCSQTKSVTSTKTQSWTTSSTTAYRYPATAKTGYYRVSFCMNYNKYLIYKWKGSTFITTYTCALPTDQYGYLSGMYSYNNKNFTRVEA